MPTFIIVRSSVLLVQFMFFFVGIWGIGPGHLDEGVRWILPLSIGVLALFTIWKKEIALAFVASIIDTVAIQAMLDVTPLSIEDLRFGMYVLFALMMFAAIVGFLGIGIYVLTGTVYRLRWILLAQAVAWFSILLTTAFSHIEFPWYSRSLEFHPWMIGVALMVMLFVRLFIEVRNHRWEDPHPIGGGYTAPSVSEGEAEIPYSSSLGH